MIPIANINEIKSLSANFKIKPNFNTEIDALLKTTLRSKNEESLLGLIFSLIDLTSLEGADTNAKIEEVCNNVLALEEIKEIPNVAAICIYPVFAKQVSHKLKNTKLNTACVAAGF